MQQQLVCFIQEMQLKDESLGERPFSIPLVHSRGKKNNWRVQKGPLAYESNPVRVHSVWGITRVIQIRYKQGHDRYSETESTKKGMLKYWILELMKKFPSALICGNGRGLKAWMQQKLSYWLIKSMGMCFCANRMAVVGEGYLWEIDA